MANRYPLILDADGGNKIKELPSLDNLNLRESSIVNVQNINALGTIDAAVISVNGTPLLPQQFADLTDTPVNFAGAEDYFVKVNSSGTGIEFRPFSDIGNIDVNAITVTGNIMPDSSNVIYIGDDINRFQRVTASELAGNLVAYDGTTVFDAETGYISYAALQGAPTALSELVDDIGFVSTTNLPARINDIFDNGVSFHVDVVGSVYGDDSALLVDGINNQVVGVINTTTGTFSDGINSTSVNRADGGTLSIMANTGQLVLDGATVLVYGELTAVNGIIGDLTGSVLASDSTVIIDGTSGTIPGYISVDSLKSAVTASATYSDFVTYINSL